MTRDKQLHVRVTGDQLARFQLAADAKGLSLSRWIVELLSNAATPQKKGSRQRRASRWEE